MPGVFVVSADLRITQPQADYIRGLQKRLHLSDRLLDAHCQSRFGSERSELDRRQASSLIDEMAGWQSVPAELQRQAGQMELL